MQWSVQNRTSATIPRQADATSATECARGAALAVSTLTAWRGSCIIAPPMRSGPLALVAAAVLAAASAVPARATESTQGLAQQALEECTRGREAAARAERVRHFEAGLAIAERAVRANPRNADAYFARFCNKGELARIDGESVGALIALGDLMEDLDRSIALEPNNAKALASKGIMLIRLPRLFGGDAAAGEAMLRRVLELDPNAVSSRLVLAERCDERGEHDEAMGLARRALEIATAERKHAQIAEAEGVLAKLGDD